MASNKRQIKRRISTTKNIAKITKAMEMVSASKMKKAQDQAIKNRAYTRALEESLKRVAGNSDHSLHPFLAGHEEGSRVLILISTNKGLCGALNSTLFRQVIDWTEKNPKGELIAVGKKAEQFVQKMGFALNASYPDFPEQVAVEDSLSIAGLIMQEFLGQRFQTVSVLYMDFINTISQKPRVTRLLPIASQATTADDLEVIPTLSKEYSFEPSPKQILNELLPYYIENILYQLFLEAKASEHSARMIAMKNASENANELIGELQLLYNKSRQAAITEELRDISTASLSLES